MLTVCCQQIGAGPELKPSQAHKQQATATKTTTKMQLKNRNGNGKNNKNKKNRNTEKQKNAQLATHKKAHLFLYLYLCVCVWKKLTNILQHFRPTVLHESLRLSASLYAPMVTLIAPA